MVGISINLCSLTVHSQVDDEVQWPDAARLLREVASWRGRCGVLLALKATPLSSLREQRGQTKWIEFVKKLNEKTALCEPGCAVPPVVEPPSSRDSLERLKFPICGVVCPYFRVSSLCPHKKVPLSLHVWLADHMPYRAAYGTHATCT